MVVLSVPLSNLIVIVVVLTNLCDIRNEGFSADRYWKSGKYPS